MTDFSPAIRKLLSLSLVGFALIALLLGYWQVVMAPRLNADQKHNTRQQMALKRIQPGRLLTQDGEVILQPSRQAGEWGYTYPGGRDFAHLTGYKADTGLQKGLRQALYGLGDYADPWRDLLRGGAAGNDVTLTIDSRAQKLATAQMEGKRGAVVALDARTGATRVLVSAPAYDPAQVMSSELETGLFHADPGSPELNRAVLGLYAPGSVFKIFTAAVGLDLGLATPESTFSCAGTERVARAKVKCRIEAGHGRLNLDKALYDSCNIAFAKLGDKIGIESFIEYTKKFHLLDPADLALPSKEGRMYDFRGFKGEVALAEAAFGQGATMLSPLQVARLTLAIANGGHVLQPYLLANVTSPGREIPGKAKDFGQAVTPETAAAVAGMMLDVVERGTGRVAQIRGVEVAGKTGSAEHGKGAAHAWFTCFAPADKPEVVVTVVVEGGGSGSESAGPVARRVLEQLLEAPADD